MTSWQFVNRTRNVLTPETIPNVLEMTTDFWQQYNIQVQHLQIRVSSPSNYSVFNMTHWLNHDLHLVYPGGIQIFGHLANRHHFETSNLHRRLFYLASLGQLALDSRQKWKVTVVLYSSTVHLSFRELHNFTPLHFNTNSLLFSSTTVTSYFEGKGLSYKVSSHNNYAVFDFTPANLKRKQSEQAIHGPITL